MPLSPVPQQSVPIRAVIFDIGGVVVRTADNSGRKAWELRLGVAAGELDELVFDSAISEQATLGLVTEDAVWAHVAEQLKLDDTQRLQLARDFWSGERLDAALMQFLRDLRPRYQTAFLSNAWSGARAAHTEHYKISDAVDLMVLSCEVGLAKPDPRIYQLTAQRLGVRPEEAVFVDDIERNVLAAREVGMRSIRFISAEQTMDDMRRLLGGDSGV